MNPSVACNVWQPHEMPRDMNTVRLKRAAQARGLAHLWGLNCCIGWPECARGLHYWLGFEYLLVLRRLRLPVGAAAGYRERCLQHLPVPGRIPQTSPRDGPGCRRDFRPATSRQGAGDARALPFATERWTLRRIRAFIKTVEGPHVR
jgi:hypothetical protein